jgi:hypothetical protein
LDYRHRERIIRGEVTKVLIYEGAPVVLTVDDDEAKGQPGTIIFVEEASAVFDLDPVDLLPGVVLPLFIQDDTSVELNRTLRRARLRTLVEGLLGFLRERHGADAFPDDDRERDSIAITLNDVLVEVIDLGSLIGREVQEYIPTDDLVLESFVAGSPHGASLDLLHDRLLVVLESAFEFSSLLRITFDDVFSGLLIDHLSEEGLIRGELREEDLTREIVDTSGTYALPRRRELRGCAVPFTGKETGDGDLRALPGSFEVGPTDCFEFAIASFEGHCLVLTIETAI